MNILLRIEIQHLPTQTTLLSFLVVCEVRQSLYHKQCEPKILLWLGECNHGVWRE